MQTYRVADESLVLSAPLSVPGVGVLPISAAVIRGNGPALLDASAPIHRSAYPTSVSTFDTKIRVYLSAPVEYICADPSDASKFEAQVDGSGHGPVVHRSQTRFAHCGRVSHISKRSRCLLRRICQRSRPHTNPFGTLWQTTTTT
jgi:hypothetical protein